MGEAGEDGRGTGSMHAERAEHAEHACGARVEKERERGWGKRGGEGTGRERKGRRGGGQRRESVECKERTWTNIVTHMFFVWYRSHDQPLT